MAPGSIIEPILVFLQARGVKYLSVKGQDHAIFSAIVGKRHVFDMRGEYTKLAILRI
jgi:hypothetical protein